MREPKQPDLDYVASAGKLTSKLMVTVCLVRETLERRYCCEGLSTGSSSNPRASDAVTG
jgi:hypothetical protein